MIEPTIIGDCTLYHGDNRDVLRQLPDNSISSVVTDPPYALVSIVKRFGGANAAPAKGNDAYMRASAGFMGRTWDTGEVAFSEEFWREVLRVLKPGGHVAAFGASRGYHRMACAIEDAGFEIRDSLMWIYGTGFPKSHDVSKGIDKAAGAEREVVGRRPDWVASASWRETEGRSDRLPDSSLDITVPATDTARQWQGWGTALKPAFEPIVLARKPLSESTVAANVLRWGTGALNIDGCRVPTGGEDIGARNNNVSLGSASGGIYGSAGGFVSRPNDAGRWPANVVHDGSDEVVGAFPQSNGQLAPLSTKPGSKTSNVYGKMNRDSDIAKIAAIAAEFLDMDISATLVNGRDGEASAERRYTDKGGTNFAMKPGARRGDSGSAARFFYSAKASKADRAGSKHPTVKPVALMEWLATLITPPGGTVLDPFAGSGTTGAAAVRKGFKAILCEREDEYVEDIKRRMALPVAAAVAAQPANDNIPPDSKIRDLFSDVA